MCLTSWDLVLFALDELFVPVFNDSNPLDRLLQRPSHDETQAVVCDIAAVTTPEDRTVSLKQPLRRTKLRIRFGIAIGGY